MDYQNKRKYRKKMKKKRDKRISLQTKKARHIQKKKLERISAKIVHQYREKLPPLRIKVNENSNVAERGS